MFTYYKNKLIHNINQQRCNYISRNSENFLPTDDFSPLTIFYDFEGEYSGDGRKLPSLHGVSDTLDIHSKYGIRATYNIVAKLITDFPEIVLRIKSDGHEIASHSYNHVSMRSLSKDEMLADLIKTKRLFESIGVKFRGFRSPQGKWNFRQMHLLFNHGICWSAEGDKAKYPYVLLHGKDRVLVRMPVTMDDWAYQSKKVHPETMFDMLMAFLDTIALEKKYGAIGFHPWVLALDERRIGVFERFIKIVSERNDIRVKTFGEMYDYFLESFNQKSVIKKHGDFV